MNRIEVEEEKGVENRFFEVNESVFIEGGRGKGRGNKIMRTCLAIEQIEMIEQVQMRKKQVRWSQPFRRSCFLHD